jgi:hypothetical protein
MDIILSLNPDLEEGLTERARKRGLTLDAYLQEVIVKEAREPQEAGGREERPIGLVIQERMKRVPAEILASMPKDGASQHDHYIYGLPKRKCDAKV